MRKTTVILVTLCFLVATAQPALALEPVPVVATDADEGQPAASADFVAWSVDTKGHYDLYAERFSHRSFKVNAKGTEGVTGAIDGSTLVYQQFVHGSGPRSGSDIYFFDLRTKDRSKAPKTINTNDWEFMPRMSGDWVLFGRWFKDGTSDLILYNMSTDESRTLAEISRGGYDLWPGQVDDDFATWGSTVWSHHAYTSCDVFVYDIPNQTTTTVPNPGSKCQYGSSVDSSGTVYYGRSGFTCGKQATLNGYPVGGPSTKLLSLKRGVDFMYSYAVDNADGTVDVFFDRGSCKSWSADIVKITAS